MKSQEQEAFLELCSEPEMFFLNVYDDSLLQVTLQVVEEHAAGVVDQVNAYFGMRKIEVAPDFKGAPRIMLNGKVEMNIGMLDQGFWPDGLYTAPSGGPFYYDW